MEARPLMGRIVRDAGNLAVRRLDPLNAGRRALVKEDDMTADRLNWQIER